MPEKHIGSEETHRGHLSIRYAEVSSHGRQDCAAHIRINFAFIPPLVQVDQFNQQIYFFLILFKLYLPQSLKIKTNKLFKLYLPQSLKIKTNKLSKDQTNKYNFFINFLTHLPNFKIYNLGSVQISFFLRIKYKQNFKLCFIFFILHTRGLSPHIFNMDILQILPQQTFISHSKPTSILTYEYTTSQCQTFSYSDL